MRALVNHDPAYVLGRNVAGTLKMEEDDHGLRVVIRPPEAQWAADLITSMKRGDIDQMSFQFETLSDEWRKEEGKQIRVLQKVKLWDVSVVTYPAYSQTVAHVRDVFNAHQAEDARGADGELSQKDGSPDGQETTNEHSSLEVVTTELQEQPVVGTTKVELARMRLDILEKQF